MAKSVEYIEGVSSSYQLAYESVLQQLGCENFIYTFTEDIYIEFPAEWGNTNFYIRRSASPSTYVFYSALNNIFTSSVTNSIYTIGAYVLRDTNFLSIQPRMSNNIGVFINYIDNDYYFFHLYGYLGVTGGTNYEVILSESRAVSFGSSSNTSASSTCFICTQNAIPSKQKAERCIIYPLIMIGGFSQEPKVINNYCVLNTATSYPIGTTFEYNDSTWELLATTDSSSRSYLCVKVAGE